MNSLLSFLHSSISIFIQTTLFLFLFSLPLFYSLETQQIFSVNKYILILLCMSIFSAAFAIQSLLQKKIRIPSSPTFWIISVIFCVTVILSTLNAESVLESFFGGSSRHWGSLFLGILFFFFLFLLSQNFTKKQIHWNILFPLICSALVSSLWAILQDIEMYPVFEGIVNFNALSDRSFAGMGQPNFLAQILIIPFSFSIYAASSSFKNAKTLQQKKMVSIISALAFLLFLFAILATESRAGIIGFSIVCFISLFTIIPSSLQKKYYVSTVTIVMLGLISLWLIIFFFGNEISVFLGERGQSIAARYYFWNDSIPLIQEYFLMGVGGDMLQSYLAQHLSFEGFAAENFSAYPDRTHTVLIDFLLHFGVIPFVIVLVAFFATLKQAVSNFDSLSLFASAGIIGTFSCWIFGFPVLTDSIFCVVAASIIWRKNIHTYQKVFRFSFSSGIIQILILSISFFSAYLFFSTLQSVAQSEKSQFILMNTPHLSPEKTHDHFLRVIHTPFLSDNILTISPLVSLKDQAQILSLAAQQNYQNISLPQIQMFSALTHAPEDKKIIREYYFQSQQKIGNQALDQTKFLMTASQFKILTPQEIAQKKKEIQKLFPEQYRNIRNSNDPIIQKFIKHHGETIEMLFQ